MSNLFNAKEKEMTGKVVVRTRPSYLVKGSTIQHVVRNTADDAAVATTMMAHTDIVKFCDMAVVMSAFVAGVKDLIANGNAVRISGLGTFYLTAKEGEEGKSDFDVGFTPDKDLVESAKTAEAHITMQSESEPAIESVIDVDTMEENGKISAGKFVILNGKRLRMAGIADDDASGTGGSGGLGGTKSTGIFMAPCDNYGNYKTDRSDWIRVEDKDIIRNFMTEVIFRVPDIKGEYRVVILTKAPLNGSTRRDKLLKHARTGASGVVTVEKGVSG